jgi:hypothetical protein
MSAVGQRLGGEQDNDVPTISSVTLLSSLSVTAIFLKSRRTPRLSVGTMSLFWTTELMRPLVWLARSTEATEGQP